MRASLIVMAFLVLLPGVVAVGVGVPEDLDDELYFDIGDDEEITFVLKGDSNNNTIEFFLYTDTDDLLAINNNRDEWYKKYVLDPYEEVQIPVSFEALKEGETQVTWGFTYLPDSAKDFEIRQSVTKTFDVEIGDFRTSDSTSDSTSGSTNDDSEGTTEINFTDTGRKNGSSLAEREARFGEIRPNVAEDEEVQNESVQTGAGNQNPSSEPSRVNTFGNEGDAQQGQARDSTGKAALLTMMVLFVLTAGLSFTSYNAVKGESDE